MSGSPSLACSASSLDSGEPLAGTASEARYFAAVSWPKALWHEDKIALSEGLPANLRELEKSAKKAGQKLQLRLFQRAQARTDRVELLCTDFQTRRSAELRDLAPEDCAAAIGRFLAGDVVATPLARPLVLVCTDGKHDLCCAKLGRGVVAALRADARVDVAEVSHLGGHRLAANALVLPTGELYGRVDAADVPSLVEAAQHGRVYLARYRGRSGYDELAQVAEAAALARHPGAEEREIGAPAIDGAARVLRVGLATGDSRARLAVRCVTRAFEAISSCGDAAPERRERWVVESVREEPS
jgi:hypothetical protein